MAPLIVLAIPTLATTLAAGTFAAFAVNTAAAIVLSIGTTWLQRKIAADNAQAAQLSNNASGASADLQLGADTPRQVLIGRVGTAGQLVYATTYGAQGNTLQMVFALGDCICD